MVNELWHGRRYYSLGSYIKNTYGQRLYKLPLSSGATCPNRDGSKGSGGCIFCSEKGSGDYASDGTLSLSDQIRQAKETVGTKFSDGGYIAYFQSFTATYAPIEHLRRIFWEAVSHPEVKVLSIATRPDCLDEERYELIRDLNREKPVWVELGLQTTKGESVKLINRCYETKEYDDAIKRLNNMGVKTITHVILGLPGENAGDMLSTVKHAVDMGTWGIKLQLLHVLKGTVLAQMYEKGQFNVLTEDEYVRITAECLEIIPQDRVIHRLTGDGPKEILIAPEWSTHKRSVLNHIHHYLKSHDTFQGKALK